MRTDFLDAKNWDFQEPVEKQQIEYVESYIKKKFPTSYKIIIEKFNGGTPKIDLFNIPGTNMGDGIGVLLSLKSEKDDYFPKNLKIFHENADGSFLCFDFSNDANFGDPPVVQWRSRVKNDFLDYFDDPAEFFPQELVAFAENGSGNYICFDYRKAPNTDNPPIVYWDHEAPEDESVYFLANNFDEFLDMLYEG